MENNFLKTIRTICRNCGKEISYADFVKSRVCPHCNKNQEDYIKDLHIFFDNDIQVAYKLKNYNDTLYENFIEYRYFSLEYFMEIGDLSNVPDSNSQEYDYIYLGDASLVKRRINSVLETIKQFAAKTKVFLWVDENRVEQYLNYLYFSKEFKVFDEVYFIPLQEGNVKNDYNPKKALDKKKKLSKAELDRLYASFNKIKTADGNFNVLFDKRVKSVPLKKYCDKVLSSVSVKYESDLVVDHRYYKKYKDTQYQLTYFQLKRVLSYLKANNKIEFKFLDEQEPFNKLRLKKEQQESKSKKSFRLTKNDKDLAFLLYKMGFETKDVNGVFLFSHSEKTRECLLKYLKYKGKYATVSDALSFCGGVNRLNGERYQCLPHKMFVRYLGETNNELNKGDYYQVYTVYGVKDRSYYLINERDKYKEYPARDFVLLRPTRIIYIGPEENGLVPGNEYNVVEQKGMRYILENGKETDYFQADEIEFVPAEEKPKQSIEHEKLLQMARHAFEFGDIRQIYERMTADTVYYSEWINKTVLGNDKISDYIENIFKNRVEQNVFADTEYCTVTSDADTIKKGDRFLILHSSNGDKNAIFVYSDGTFITKILITDKIPSHESDEPKLNKLSEK